MSLTPAQRCARRAPALAVGLILATAPVLAVAQTPAPTATAVPAGDASGPAQFYVLSFTGAPIAEVAEGVIGGALGQAAAVDPAVEGAMSFRAEGWFSPDALLREFGAALLDQDVALVRSAEGDLALVPRPDIAPELARGAVLVTVAATPAVGATTTSSAPGPAAPIVYGRARWRDGPVGALLIFLAGCAAGAGALAGGTLLRRRRRLAARRPAPIRLHIAHTPSDDTRSGAVEDPELVIPRFDAPSEPLDR